MVKFDHIIGQEYIKGYCSPGSSLAWSQYKAKGKMSDLA